MSPLAWLALGLVLLAILALVAVAVNPYREFEDEAHANDSDEDPPPIPGSVIPELDRLNERDSSADDQTVSIYRLIDSAQELSGAAKTELRGEWDRRLELAAARDLDDVDECRCPDISPRDEAEAQAVAERVIANLQRQRDEWEADEFQRRLS